MILNVYFLIYKVVLEDDGFFPRGIDASHVNNVSYNFDIKIFIEMVLLCSAFI